MHTKVLLLLAAFVLCGVPMLAQNTATLTVSVDGVTARGGMLRVELYTEASYTGGALAVDSRAVKASAGTQTVTFVGLPPGYYAAYAVQDVSQSGGRGRVVTGGSTLPFGYSGYVSRSQRPAFRDIRFSVSPGNNVTIIHLHL